MLKKPNTQQATKNRTLIIFCLSHLFLTDSHWNKMWWDLMEAGLPCVSIPAKTWCVGACGGTGPHEKQEGTEGDQLWRLYVFNEYVPHMAGDHNLEQKASGKPPAQWCQWEVSVPSGVSAEQQMCRSAGFAQVLVGHKAQYSWSGVNRAVNNLLFLSSPNVSMALKCFCRPFYASPVPMLCLLPF